MMCVMNLALLRCTGRNNSHASQTSFTLHFALPSKAYPTHLHDLYLVFTANT